MRYQDHPGYDKAYVIMRCSGFGVMEANYVDEEIVFQTDDQEEAYEKARSLTNENNTPKQIKSSWIPNTYWVHANTLTAEGKRLLDAFNAENKAHSDRIRNHPDFVETKIGNVTIHSIGEPSKSEKDLWTPKKVAGSPMGQSVWNGTSWEFQ
ncbi:MAG: hypothetical protein V4721_10310 [Bacteroidota bacterium]